MGIELELAVLYVLQTVGHSVFDKFEVEAEAWRKIVKWLLLAALTVALYHWSGHWALVLPLAAGLAGAVFHLVWCRKHGIHPLHATPRREYYRLRDWAWPER